MLIIIDFDNDNETNLELDALFITHYHGLWINEKPKDTVNENFQHRSQTL
jgi:hypothetical protein